MDLATQYPEGSMEETIAKQWQSIKERADDDPIVNEVSQSATDDTAVEDQENHVEQNEDEISSENSQTDARKPPSSWKKEAKELYATLDPRIQDEIDRREKDNITGIQRYKQQAELGERFERTITPYLATIRGLGVEPDIAVGELLKADHALRYGNPTQKLAFMRKLANDYGVDLGGIVQHQEQQQYIDPNLAQLQQSVTGMAQYLQSQEQNRQRQEEMALQSEIQSFAKDKPHFEELKPIMAALLQAGTANDLSTAYDMAVYANPQVRSEMLAQQQQKTTQERQQKVNAARNASAVNVKAKGLSSAAKQTGSMDDTIRAEAQRLGMI